MDKYRKKPVIVEAKQWFELRANEPVAKFYHHHKQYCRTCGESYLHHGWVKTLEGGHIVCPGDWIVKGVEGEYYPVKNAIFLKTYEKVNNETTNS